MAVSKGFSSLLQATGLGLTLLGTSQAAMAYALYASDQASLNADFLAVYGLFNSDKNYDGTTGGSTWQEALVQYGLSGDYRLAGKGQVYGRFNWVSAGTWGDGDASGATDGSERKTAIEEAHLGWRSGGLLPWLGEDGLDVSLGRQIVTLGDGFLLNDDGLNLGKGFDAALNRGGAYWLAARRAFDETLVVRFGGEEGVHGTLAWLKSDNRAQAKTELAALALEYTTATGTLGFTGLQGLGVDEQWADAFQQERDGMKVYSLRGAGDAGVDNARFAFEYARQDKDSGKETAWYLEAGYAFPDLPWAPSLTYRYSRYSEAWDSLFNGFSRGYGTWFQGEVAANYAGPFNSNNSVQHLGLQLTPSETLTLGVLYFDFSSLDKGAENLAARELNVYADWVVKDYLIVSPLLGWYKPEQDDTSGGSQAGGKGANLYSQLVVAVPF